MDTPYSSLTPINTRRMSESPISIQVTDEKKREEEEERHRIEEERHRIEEERQSMEEDNESISATTFSSLSSNQATLLFNQAMVGLNEIDKVIEEEKTYDLLHQTNQFMIDQQQLIHRIESKIGNFKQYIHTLRFRYSDYFKSLMLIQIIIIVLGAVITLFSGIFVAIETNPSINISTPATITSSVIPAVLGSTITVLGAIMSLKKYKTKTEVLSNTISRCVEIRTKLDGMKEKTEGCTTMEALLLIRQSYFGEILNQMNTCQAQVGELVNLQDQVHSTEKINYLETRKLESNSISEVQQAEIKKRKEIALSEIELQ